MIDTIKSNKYFFFPLGLSLLFFLRKGIQYAILESYIPLLVIVTALLLLSVAIALNKQVFLLLSRIWAVLIIGWSVIRLFVSVVSNATSTFDEYHLSNQFGIGGILLSILMLTVGILINRNAKVMDWL